MTKPHLWTLAEQEFLHSGGVESFSQEWYKRRAMLWNKKHINNGDDLFSEERYQFGRQEYQGYVLREE